MVHLQKVLRDVGVLSVEDLMVAEVGQKEVEPQVVSFSVALGAGRQR